MSLKITTEMLEHSADLWSCPPDELYELLNKAVNEFATLKQKEKDSEKEKKEAAKKASAWKKAQKEEEAAEKARQKRTDKLKRDVKKAQEWVAKEALGETREHKIAQKKQQKLGARWPRIFTAFKRSLKQQDIAEKKAVKEAKAEQAKAEKAEEAKKRAAKKAQQEEEKAQKKLEREKKKAEKAPTRTNAKSGYGLWRKSLAGNHYTQSDFSSMWEEFTPEIKQQWKDQAAEVNAANAEVA